MSVAVELDQSFTDPNPSGTGRWCHTCLNPRPRPAFGQTSLVAARGKTLLQTLLRVATGPRKIGGDRAGATPWRRSASSLAPSWPLPSSWLVPS
jgi:hypothetical protein